MQAILALRPLNLENWVHGYPGIPSTEDSPPAVIKGVIQVRPAVNCKAKWVRIELRRIEALPGRQIFTEVVAGSQITLWQPQTGEAYDLLQMQDLNFSIRIPENVPPSIALEQSTGISYELVASSCVKGKGWFRRAKPITSSVAAPVIIDKHELHSTWPIYSQPEMRKIEQEGVTLIVEQEHTCYGPGDRVSVIATLRADNLHTVILRGFELMLKETTTYQAGDQERSPEVKALSVGHQKVAVNATLYGGTQKRTELSCQIPLDHTVPSINTARHITVTYTICVKVVLEGAHVLMDVPVIITNWPRVVSVEAVKRIGSVPSLSIMDIGEPTNTSHRETARGGNTYAQQSLPRAAHTSTRNSPPLNPKPYHTVPNGGYADSIDTPVDEFGGYSRATGGGGGGGYGQMSSSSTSAAAAKLPPSSQYKQATANQQPGWPSAESEKQRLYNSARDRAERVQENARAKSSPEISSPLAPSPATSRSHWPTAEEEKSRLFEAAQARAQRTQEEGGTRVGRNDSYPGSSGSGSRPGASSTANGTSSSSAMAHTHISTPQYPSADQEKAALRAYERAKGAVDRTQGLGIANDEGSSSSTPTAYKSLYPSSSAQPQTEKQRLERDPQPRDAAASVRSPAYESPPPPPPAAGAYDRAPQPTAYAPNTPMNATSGFQIVSEKEALARKYAEQDARAQQQQGYSEGGSGKPPSFSPTPPPRSTSSSSSRSSPAVVVGGSNILSAIDEKALLRAKYDAEENGGSGSSHAQGSSPLPPPPLMPRPPAEYIHGTRSEDAVSRTGSSSSSSTRQRPPPPLDPLQPFTPFGNGFEVVPAPPPVSRSYR